jgi:hypothetical protein
LPLELFLVVKGFICYVSIVIGRELKLLQKPTVGEASIFLDFTDIFANFLVDAQTSNDEFEEG